MPDLEHIKTGPYDEAHGKILILTAKGNLADGYGQTYPKVAPVKLALVIFNGHSYCWRKWNAGYEEWGENREKSQITNFLCVWEH